MKKLILALTAISSLAGCASQNALNEKKQAYSQCNIKYPKEKGKYYLRASCLDSADYDWAAKVNYPFEEISSITSARDSLAKQLDAGEITREQASAEFQKAASRSNAQAAAVRAENRRNAAAIMLRNGAYQTTPYIAPTNNMMGLPSRQYPTQTNCISNSMGQTIYTNCQNTGR